MAKKYNPAQPSTTFTGAAQSLGFNAVRAVDTSKQFEQRTKERNRDVQTQKQHLQRAYNVQNAQLNSNRAKSNAQFGAIRGLMGIVGKTTGAMADFAKQQEAEALRAEKQREQDLITNQQLESMGMMGIEQGDPEMGTQTVDTVVGTAQNQTMQVEAEGQAINEVADDLPSTAPGSAHELRQSATQVRYTGVQGNIYSARSGHRNYLNARINELPDAQRPRTEAEAAALIARYNQDYFRESGVFDNPETRKIAARELYQTVNANSTAVASAMVKGAIEFDRKANASEFGNTIYQAVKAPGANAASLWQTASDGTAFGNMGFNGRSAASNEAAIKEVIQQAVAADNPEILMDLMDTPKIPGQPNGPTLGSQYGSLIQEGIEKAQAARRGVFKNQEAEMNLMVDQDLREYWKNPTPEARQALVRKLQAIPTGAAQRQLRQIMGEGLGIDQNYELELAQRAARGEEISVQELDEALKSGMIRKQVYDQRMAGNADVATSEAAKKATQNTYQTIVGMMQSSMPTNIPLTPTMKTEMQRRARIFQVELARRVSLETRGNTALQQNPMEMAKVVDAQMAEMMKQPQYQINTNPKDGAFWNAPLTTSHFDQKVSPMITVAPGQQDFREVRVGQILDSNIVPKSELSAEDDYLLTEEAVLAAAQALQGDTAVDQRVTDLAKGMGLSPKALVEGQLKRYNMPTADVAAAAPPASEPQADLDLKGGYNYITNQLGFPARGAAYLTSAVDHESAWNGKREWGQVAGDGTSRNGGLISWAAWSNDPARLGKIERYFGTSIANIPEQAQLNYMKMEMQQSYRAAYRIFMDPNASSADLQWAVSNYWGFDPKYTGSRWSDAERYISRPPV